MGLPVRESAVCFMPSDRVIMGIFRTDASLVQMSVCADFSV